VQVIPIPFRHCVLVQARADSRVEPVKAAVDGRVRRLPQSGFAASRQAPDPSLVATSLPNASNVRTLANGLSPAAVYASHSFRISASTAPPQETLRPHAAAHGHDNGYIVVEKKHLSAAENTTPLPPASTYPSAVGCFIFVTALALALSASFVPLVCVHTL
jgi:hypothetical protein